MEEENRDEYGGFNYATEILGGLRTMNKRLWVALIVVLCMWTATIGGFVWYISQYDYVSYTQDGGIQQRQCE